MPFVRLPLAVFSLVLCFTASAAAAPIGPVYPPPGGVTLTDAGDPGRAGGASWTYENFDFAAFDQMWWGPWDVEPIELAFDGAVDEPGETLTFDAAQSDLPGGLAIWTGSADVPLFGGGSAILQTRFVLRTKTLGGSPVAMIDPVTEGIPASAGSVAPVSGDYRAEYAFEAFQGGTWKGALDAYDSMPTAADDEVISSFSAGFYYTPVCGDGVTEGDEECDDGATNGTLDSCCSGSCTFEPALVACEDGDLCTQAGECDGAGTCIGSDPVVCTASDQCHDAGVCDSGTGLCSDPEKADGTACSDADACTLDDSCQAGVCEAGVPTLSEPLANPTQTVECVLQTLPAP